MENPDKGQKVLFDSNSGRNDSPESKYYIYLEGQVTFNAINLAEDDVITFEILHLGSGKLPEARGCFIKPAELPRVTGVSTLYCKGCNPEADGTHPPVRLTADSPVVILDAPQYSLIRAMYHGSGIGQSTVYASIGTRSKFIPSYLTGCPDICCERDDDSWQSTGHTRCNIKDDKLEALMVDNCGFEEWQVVDDLRWEDTGETRPLKGDKDTEKQQVNNCGDLRWVKGDGQVWSDTGIIRSSEDDSIIEKQEKNQFGRTRWVKKEDAVWKDTGAERCNDHDLERQQVNQAGATRWNSQDEPCGYMDLATYDFPEGGFGYAEGQKRDPRATVKLEDCDGNVIAYIYPNPISGATTPVKQAEDDSGNSTCGPCDDGEILGYAVNCDC